MKLLVPVLLLLSMLATKSYAATIETPKDTTAGIIDKSAAILLIDKGKQMVIDRQYREALLTFREAAVKDPYTWKAPYWISYCHYHLNNYGYARQYGLSALSKGGTEIDKEVYDILGNSFHRMGSLDSAQMFYQKALNELPKQRVKELNIEHKLAECAYAKKIIATPNERELLRGEVNSGYNDYCPLFSADGKTLYFTSRRGNTTGGQMNPDDQEYYEDVYKGVWNAETQMWDSISNDIERINTDGFDALNWISSDGLHGVITWNNTYSSEAKTITKSSDICEVEITKMNKWSTAKIIQNKSINTTFFEGSATLTADGNTMYFVSDRKGDKRSTDIYMVQKTGKKWGTAVLLPDSINSVGRETTPYITPDGRFLFFSSDGHLGIGGLDIYVCERTGSGWSAPMNLGAGINTVNDDTHFKVYKELGKILMAGVNISGQKSSYDIYQIDLSKVTLPVKL